MNKIEALKHSRDGRDGEAAARAGAPSPTTTRSA
jgi:hypothetical protein